MNNLTFARMIKYIEGYPFEDYFTYDNVGDFIHYLYDNCEEFLKGTAKCYHGCSKCVIVIKDCSYVIKIPFNGFWDDIDRKNIPFYGASCDNGWDYCEAEENRFKEAKQFHFEKYFAETKFVYLTKNGIRIYIQDKCSPILKSYRRNKENADEYRKIERKYSSRTHNWISIEEPTWIVTFVKLYGYEELERFLDFLSESEWDDDLTADNIGYRNNEPVLIDYCSFWDQFLYEIWRQQHGR